MSIILDIVNQWAPNIRPILKVMSAEVLNLLLTTRARIINVIRCAVVCVIIIVCIPAELGIYRI